jgi:hypothetical protein
MKIHSLRYNQWRIPLAIVSYWEGCQQLLGAWLLRLPPPCSLAALILASRLIAVLVH